MRQVISEVTVSEVIDFSPKGINRLRFFVAKKIENTLYGH